MWNKPWRERSVFTLCHIPYAEVKYNEFNCLSNHDRCCSAQGWDGITTKRRCSTPNAKTFHFITPRVAAGCMFGIAVSDIVTLTAAVMPREKMQCELAHALYEYIWLGALFFTCFFVVPIFFRAFFFTNNVVSLTRFVTVDIFFIPVVTFPPLIFHVLVFICLIKHTLIILEYYFVIILR